MSENKTDDSLFFILRGLKSDIKAIVFSNAAIQKTVNTIETEINHIKSQNDSQNKEIKDLRENQLQCKARLNYDDTKKEIRYLKKSPSTVPVFSRSFLLRLLPWVVSSLLVGAAFVGWFFGRKL